MPLNPGVRLGPYEVVAQAGAGGMGEVYRARDTRLDRTVAIKVLPSHVAAAPELRERFEREARAVAALNHPHICTLHDVGQQDGIDFLVMEYLEGETLAERLKKGAVPMPQALQYAIEIADALDRAHRAGIVHRDLKPGNIMLTKSGAKLLDFGLAKTGANGAGGVGTSGGIGAPGAVALASAIARVSMMPTEVTPLTMEGTILGTLQYMAPEQLQGREADARTDIFAFGAVLYEMVTGARAFGGKSQVSLMAAIMDQEPAPLSAVLPVTPPLLDHCIGTCFAKNPDARWQHAGDLLIQLKLIADLGSRPEVTAAPTTGTRPTRVAWAAAATLLAATVALAAVVAFGGNALEPAKVSFRFETPSQASPLQIAVSPDGTRVAAVVPGEGGGPGVLWVRALENLVGQTLPRTEGAQHPFWSPDGRAIGFFADNKLKKVDLLGAPPQTLCDVSVGSGGTWNRDGVIVFGSQLGPLFQVSASGGIPVQLTELDTSQTETVHRHPFFLPDGDHFLYTAVSGKPELSAVYVGSLSSRDRKRLVSSTLKAVFAPPDHLLFMRDNSTLLAQRLDPDRLELSGAPFPAVTEDVGINQVNSAAGFTVSANGVLAYRTGGAGQRALGLFDAAGTRLATVGTFAPYESPSISPDATRVAVFFRQDVGSGDIWLLDLVRSTSSRLTFDAATDTAPIWSPDGARVVFSSNRGGSFDLYVKHSGGVGQEELLLESEQGKLPDDWSGDGRFILYRSQDAKTGLDLWVLPLEGDRKPQAFLQTPFNELQGRFSPDGRWIAYMSDESGRNEVYVQSFPVSGGKWQISTAGGVQPRWRGDGRVLFFVANGQVMAVDISAAQDKTLTAGMPRQLFRADLASTTNERNAWDVTADGQRFLINSEASAAPGQNRPVTVVVNWLSGR